jgi:hypothetical protein
MSVQPLLRPRLLASALLAAGVLGAGCGGNDSKKDSAAPAPAGATTPAAAPATAAGAAAAAAKGDIAAVDYPGVQHQHYRFGPLLIRPGQNPIAFQPTTQKPREPPGS